MEAEQFDPGKGLMEYLKYDNEEKQGAIVSLLREHLLQLDKAVEEESETFLTLWLECSESGMEEVLCLVVLQTVSGQRTASKDEFVINPAAVLTFKESLVDSAVFLRIFLFTLMRLLWYSRRSLTEKASANGPYPDASALEKIGDNEFDLINRLLALVSISTRRECRRQLLTVVHQMFLENSTLIKRVYRQQFEEALIPWAIEWVPSTHVLLDTVIEDITAHNQGGFESFKFTFAAYLAIKYPLPKTLELCNLLLERCRQLVEQNATGCLRIAVLVLEVFPTLMEQITPMLVQWSQLYSGDPAFLAASADAAHRINQINLRINSPLYQPIISLYLPK